MKLYLARHGRTNYNDLGLCNADPTVNVYLTSTGITQAKALADKLKQVPIEHIFVSELRRTRQTAEIINTFHNIQIETDSRLNDIRSGYEGKRFEEYAAALHATDDMWTARFNDGESIEDCKARVTDFIKDLQSKEYDSVLVVTSQWPVRAIVTVIKNISNEQAWELKVEQGSCLELEI